MRNLTCSLLLLALSIYSSATGSAAVETVNIVGTLAEGDQIIDGRPTDVYKIGLRENQSCKVTIQSKEFDGLLQFTRPDQTLDGRLKIEQDAKPASLEIRANPGEPGIFEVRVSKLEVTAPAQYIIQFTSTEQILDAIVRPDGKTIREFAESPNGPTGTPGTVTINGVLEAGDKTFEDGTWLDAYSFPVQAGQKFGGTIQTHDFDGQLISVNHEGKFGSKANPKKGAAATGLKSSVFKGQDGTYQLLVAATKPGDGGRYTLVITAPNGGVTGPNGKAIGGGESSPGGNGTMEGDTFTFTDSQGNKVTLPLGTAAFVDEAVSNDFGGKRPIDSATDPARATGRPDYVSSKETEGFYTMGKHGHAVWKFVDNTLEDGPGDDLVIFEIGRDTEPVNVEISTDGQTWIPVGQTEGGNNSIDLNGKAVAGESYYFLKLTDIDGRAGGRWPGADIDAIGAINGKAVSRP